MRISPLKEKTHPDKHVLDEVSKDFPVMIWHASSHMGVVNSKTLELTGLLETPNLENGVIGRYPGTQEPTCVFSFKKLWSYPYPTICSPCVKSRSNIKFFKISTISAKNCTRWRFHKRKNKRNSRCRKSAST